MIVAYAMLEETPNDFIREVRILSPDLPLLFFLDLDTQVAPESLGLLRIGTVLRKPIWGLELEETIQQFLAT
ncbi:hypothetical protein C2W62_29250 [Candidatus Entotheonella serta]|nr:hypothetical protein C2W62_29250 [Candidatus Entotheonella serta]